MLVQQAKEKVFAHLQYIDRLCNKRFIQDPALAEEAQSYVLKKLQENDWHRACQWSEKANVEFKTYLTIVVQRLLTEYQRKEYGYPRPPSWLPNEPIWQRAFTLLRIKQWNRSETIDILVTEYKTINQQEAEALVHEILKRSKDPRRNQAPVSVESLLYLSGSGQSPDDVLQSQNEHELATLLLQYIQDRDVCQLPPILLDRIKHLNKHLHLSEEDRLILRMYFVSNLTLSKIAKRLNIPGDPYKRFKKIIKQLQDALDSIGLGRYH